ncbi:MAG: Alpha-ketoglutaric semialdehyde dehydrogenase [Verrucomicrobia subdivision 3 bacterium]|nr:Alpha-ketoglutaric semialdehyde dehydrogenase [Limisphaerales bacterium]MCS1417370.1 Alpha-ketoglutaric semialdehyde dehydrogenase [Limisphaerales bacterium]
MKTQIKGHSLVSGLTIQESDTTFHAINPANDQALKPEYHQLNAASVEAIATHAQAAFSDYNQRSGAERAAFLRQIADNIHAAVEDLVEYMPAETALPEPRVRGETERTTGQLRLFANLIEEGSWVDARIETAQPDRKPLPKPDVRSVLQPLGPVIVFCASNFPLAFSVAGGDTAAALASGCPVIVKAHHSHPGTAEIVGQAVMAAVESCQMPDGTFSLVYGPGQEIGTALVKHPAIKVVGFTGSRAGGTALMKAAFERDEPIPVYAEMSSINPVVILPEALEQNGETIATDLHKSVTLGLGQFCTNPGLVLLPAGKAANRFATQLKDALANTADGHSLNAGIAEAYRSTVNQLASLQDSGVTVHHANPGDGNNHKCQVGTALFEVNAPTFLNLNALHQEAFGPSTTLITYQNQDELIQVVSAFEGQLTGTIHATGQDLQNTPNIVATLQERVGRILFGGFPTGVEVCHAMVHGGPYPSTSDGRSTSVGTMAIHRFVRAVCYQCAPDAVLPDALKNTNPLNLSRLINGQRTRDPI